MMVGMTFKSWLKFACNVCNIHFLRCRSDWLPLCQWIFRKLVYCKSIPTMQYLLQKKYSRLLFSVEQGRFTKSGPLSADSCRVDGEETDFLERGYGDEEVRYGTDEAYIRKSGSSKMFQVVRASGDYKGTYCSWYKSGMKATTPKEHDDCVRVIADVCRAKGRSFERGSFL